MTLIVDIYIILFHNYNFGYEDGGCKLFKKINKNGA